MISSSLSQLAAATILLLNALLPAGDGSVVGSATQPLEWVWFEIAPAGWSFVTSSGGVDVYFRSEGKLAMDTMMLCSGLDFQFRKVAANTFCTFPNEAANITFLGFTSSG